MPKVFITNHIPKEATSILAKNNFKVDVNNSGDNLTKDELRRVFGEYNAVITTIADTIDEDVIVVSQNNLKVVSNYGVGYDNIDVLTCKKNNIIVCNTPGVASEAVAEFTVALILACQKQLIFADKFIRDGKYKKWDPNPFVMPQIWGKKIGIIGLGKIGMLVGRMVKDGFGMEIMYHDIVRSEDFELLTDAKFTDLHALLKESDFITIHVPLTPHTKHLISKKELGIMKNSAVLINTSRGPVVDEEALIWALTEGEIAGAGLDVYEHEPHIPHELTTLSNVVLTPHIASATKETRTAMAEIAAENIIDVFEGREPAGLVKVD